MHLTCSNIFFNRQTLLVIWGLSFYSLNAVSQTNLDLTNSDLRSEQDIATESIEILVNKIRQVEAEQNTFADELGELNFDLGVQLSVLGLHEEALEAFLLADQSIKAREGLYSDIRESVLRKIYEEHVALKEWEDAEEALQHLAWLKARNLGSTSVEFVSTLQELVEWNLAKEYYGIDEGNISLSLRTVFSDLDRIYDIYDENSLPYDEKTLELAAAVNHVADSKVNIVNPNQRFGADIESNQQLSKQYTAAKAGCEHHFEGIEASDVIARSCTRSAERYLRARLPDLIIHDPFSGATTERIQQSQFFSRGYFRGQNILLDHIRTYQSAGDHPNTLDTTLRLADWYLLFGHRRQAEDTYQAAWDFAVEQRLPGLLQMGTPQPISIATVIPDLPKLTQGNQQSLAEMQVNITSNGEVSRIELTRLDIDNIQAVAELLAEYSSHRYRPAIHQGKPIAVDNYSLNAEFYY